MKRLAGLTALALIITGTGGCSWLGFRDRGSDYLQAQQTAPMRLPEGVQAKHLDPLLPIPTQIPSLAARDDEFETPRPQALVAGPDSGEFSLQKSGDARWLLALRPPAEVWPLARQYFERNGLAIAEERPQTGEFITAWQRYDRLSPELSRRLGGRVTVAAPDAQVRVRVRIEPGVQRNTSEIFLAAVERPADSTANLSFPSRSANQALDSALLDELLAGLERGAGQGGSVSLAARSADSRVRVTAGEDGSGNPVLNVEADFDRSWSSIGRALERADLRIDDLNRSLGLYYLNLSGDARKPGEKPGFFGRLFGSDEAAGERYQVRLTRLGNGVQVSLEQDADTLAPKDIAQRVLGQIQSNLN